MSRAKVALDEAAPHLLRVALAHPECAGGTVLDPVGGRPRVRLDIKVEMPLHMKAAGVSDSGVQVCEPVEVDLPERYPWQSPRFYLREDFPRSFPHLMPFSKRPRPCLVDGNQDEYFLQFGLIESGIFHLVSQLAAWLRKAAIGNLIDPKQGWEPMLRRDLRQVVECDADTARAAVTKRGGWAVWKARFFRRGGPFAALDNDATVWLSSKGQPTPLVNKAHDENFTCRQHDPDLAAGNSVAAVIWPDKLPSGEPFVSTVYMPETIATMKDLRARAEELGCGRGLTAFLANLERCFAGMVLLAPIPVGVVLCVRRPIHLIGSTSDIELLPYVFEIRAGKQRASLLAQGDDEPVAPSMHYQALTRSLMSTLSAKPEQRSIALLGCGSVGSKLALHAARAGQTVSAVSDEGLLLPHNMARHALGATHVATNKAEALACELVGLDQSPSVYCSDLVIGLGSDRERIIPRGTSAAVNSTASLAVREALVAATDQRLKARLFEAALFGRGQGAFLLMDGATHNPTHSDLVAELYATIDEPRTARLLLDPAEGLSAVQIGQGCGSLTMPMDDARLSAMTAGLSIELGAAMAGSNKNGLVVTGVADEHGASAQWSRRVVPPFEAVAIAGSDGWELRLSQRVVERIKAGANAYPNVETGGVMIGLTSARLKTVTVVDLVDAPADSTRSANRFVLGTDGLHAAIEARHTASGQSLSDVGTWHSHLADVGPSQTDWQTATDLAAERAPPSVLLIVTPRRFLAVMARYKAI